MELPLFLGGTMRSAFFTLVIIAAVTACDGTSVIPTADTGMDTSPDVIGSDLGAPDLVAPDVDTYHSAEIPCFDCWTPDINECEGPGCFGEPCAENADCDDGFCVDHMGDKVCTQQCIEDCPEGWTCQQVVGGPDVMFLCISPFRVLCRPCVDDGDCSSASGYEDRCIDYGDEGLFCGAACGDGTPCPDGYTCQEMSDADGLLSDQCVPAGGICACSDASVDLALSTNCEAVNEHGACPGHRTCTASGLSDCDAPAPALEICNGEDDDCDGDSDEDTCDDENPCTEDSCDPAAGCQHVPLDEGNCDDGDICTVTDHCTAGTCVGTPIECNDGNPCTDDACDGLQGCVFTDNTMDCDDGDPCTIGDSCKAGTCVGTGVPCDCTADADCGELEDGDLCNGTLFCDMTGVVYQCKVAPGTVISCPSPEGLDAACKAASCDPFTGTCSLIAANAGAPCSDGDMCTESDACAGGLCLGAGAMNCDDGNPCTTDGCEPLSGCVHTPAEAGCDDGNDCTTGDHCSSGLCVAGGVVPCDDANTCTTDSCHPQGGCLHEFNTAPCTDGSLCTVEDQCVDGGCVPGQAVNCDDGNACTDDICNPVTGCLHVNNTDGCDDVDPCTEGDKCSVGSCIGVTPMDCDDGNPCTNDLCIPMAGCSYLDNDNPCDDDNLCTVGDHCSQGTCVPGTPQPCDDGNPCTDDACDSEGGCSFTPNDASCDDQNSCTTDDQCTGGACIGSGSLECDDDNPCTQDVCLPGGGCQHVNLDQAPCSDGDPCTLGDVCDAGACVGGSPLVCDDGNPCTDEICADGVCATSTNQAACDDGNPCTEGDHCDGGACQPTGPVLCDDDNVCTTDYCDPTSGCVFILNDNPCNDGDLCTTNDVCAVGDCVGTGILSCTDGNLCTNDSCEPQSGCTFTPNTANCDDGNACTEGDACTGGACAPGAAVNCADANLCTTDSCDPTLGCLHVHNTAPCDDDNACTVGDLCGAGSCQPGLALVCDDSNLCTNDACAPQSGCTFTPNAIPCDDGNACTEDDVCGNAACQPGGALDCDDGNLCTTDSCEPVAGCLAVPNTAPCNDEDACTNGDACGGGACQPGATITCSDGDPCTTDSCDPDSGCVYPPITPCCGNDVVEGGEECDDGNQTPGDGCDASCHDEPVALTYLGYANWTQNVDQQSDAQQDAAMDATCNSTYGNARAATHDELVQGMIIGKPGSNNSGYWCMFKCPYCEGTSNCRKCVNPNNPWPTSHGSGWYDYCCTNTRSTICVPN